jgi:hypothetical protein
MQKIVGSPPWPLAVEKRPRLEPDVMGGKLPDGSAPFYPKKTELSERANLSRDTEEQLYE